MSSGAISWGMDKLNFLFNVGKTDVSISVGGVGDITEVGEDEIGSFNLSGETITGDLLGWWTSLLQHPVDDGLGGSTTGIIELLSVFEEVKCWETLDAESFSEGLLLGGIDLSETEWWVIFAQGFGSLLVLWSEFLAVSTPWGVKLNEDVLVLLEFLIEIFISENDNSVIEFGSSEDLGNNCE